MRILLSILLLMTLCFSVCGTCIAEAQPEPVTMLCLNVGKGDCILLRAEGQYYLVDTGFKRTSDRLLAMLEHEGVQRLAGVFLTHNHKDHYGGLTALCASGIPIDAFYAPAYCTEGTGSDHPAVIAAAKRGQSVQFLRGGDSVAISGSARFDVLGPTKLSKDNENNNSLVMRLETPEGSILLTGDMKFEEEYLLLTAQAFTHADVIKVPFHGDNTATSSTMLSQVRPQVGIISTSSKEEKDTPSREALFRLASVGCRVYVTEEAESAVRVTLSGGKVSVECEAW